MYTVKPIAIARTPFQQKFAIPRQAGLVDYPSSIELLAPFNCAEAVEGLEQVSHIWVHFLFHQHVDKEPQLQVRPPRLGGNKKLGVFATRSSFRPNHLGQSLVALKAIETSEQGITLHVSGLDVLDGTPIIDIKPYLPYADSLNYATNAIAPAPPVFSIEVEWAEQAKTSLHQAYPDQAECYAHYIQQLISLDPRPAYKKIQDFGEYAMRVFHLDIHWQMQNAKQAKIVRCVLD